MDRRGFLKSILAAGVAPYVITTAGVLMPVKAIAAPEILKLEDLWSFDNELWTKGTQSVDGPGLLRALERPRCPGRPDIIVVGREFMDIFERELRRA